MSEPLYVARPGVVPLLFVSGIGLLALIIICA